MKRIQASLLAALLTLSAAAVFAEEANGAYGNGAAKIDTNLTIQDMLTYAIQDEYMARAEYTAIMDKFGAGRPFSSIKNAESTHIGWLNGAFSEFGLAIPPDRGADRVILPASLKQAYQSGVQAEIDNIAMYDRFISTTLVQDPKNANLKQLFENLKRGSENHLKAFRNQLSKY